jgi:hypothetical protein
VSRCDHDAGRAGSCRACPVRHRRAQVKRGRATAGALAALRAPGAAHPARRRRCALPLGSGRLPAIPAAGFPGRDQQLQPRGVRGRGPPGGRCTSTPATASR